MHFLGVFTGLLFSVLALLYASSVSPVNAAVLSVPSATYPTIQSAINASVSGDTVLISDGTYTGLGNVDLDFGGRNLTVTSVNGAASTIIDCAGSSSVSHRGFYMHTGETSAVISGLTIENGYETNSSGGGIDDINVGVTVQNCVLKNNAAVATGNNATFGGGIYDYTSNSNSQIRVTNCIVTGNMATSNGGGIDMDDRNASGAITVTGCTLTGNSSAFGGGISTYGTGSNFVLKCMLIGNMATSNGGGIYNQFNGGSSPLTIRNCVLTGNLAASGGGIYTYSGGNGAVGIINCTLTTNTASSNSGGGLYNFNNGSGAITAINDIVYGDTGGEIAGSSTPATNCDVQGGYAGTSTISADPLFVNAPYDLHLQSASPCLGAGTANGGAVSTIDNVARPTPPSIGAYELSSAQHVSPQYVSPSGSNSNSGTQAAPKLTIQSAINGTASGDTVIVEDGTYTGPGNVDLDFGGRNITVTSQNGPATTIVNCAGSSSANHRGFYLHSGETSAAISGLTIENGYESNSNGGGILNYNVGVTVQNCVIKNNSANGNSAGFGGGISNYTSSAIGNISITGCTLTGNSAGGLGVGGGISNFVSGGPISVTNCLLAGNSAGNNGGGISNYNKGGGLLSVSNCTLNFNSCPSNVGGGISNYSGTYHYQSNSGPISVTNCALNGNTANDGGGIDSENDGNSTITVTNCTLTDNAASGYSDNSGYYPGEGGGLFNSIYPDNSGGSISVTNCTLTGNAASGINDNNGNYLPGEGGGLYSDDEDSGTVTANNDIFYGDTSDTGGEIANDPASTANASAEYCDIQGGYTGIGNINADPLLSPLGSYGGPTQTLALLPGSPCLGAGADAGLTADQRGIAIPQNGRYDIGAFESQGFTLATTSGNNQGANIGTAFANPLLVTVTAKAALEPVAGGLVTFTAPASGASAALTASPATIGASGTASVIATANGTAGGPYSVAADTGAGGTTFSLTNTSVAQDVTGQVSVRRGGYFFNRQRNLLQQVIILTNTGPDLTGQVVVAFDGLPQGVAVFRPDGKTLAALPAGSPYLVVVAAGGIFASGASVSVPVSFYDPAHVPAPYTPRVLAGSGD